MSKVELLKKVIDNGNCIGCGACAFAAPETFGVSMNQAGHYEAYLRDSSPVENIPTVCPMAGDGLDESQIATDLYADLPVHPQIGRYKSTLAAHVETPPYRMEGGSGGLGSWIASELIRRAEVDAILHVVPVDPFQKDGVLFEYAVSETVPAVMRGAKSRYYPITLDQILQQLQQSDKVFAVIGLPCFIKSIRMMQDEGLLPKDKVKYCIGLVCGHLKSRYFADYLAWQKGAEPGNVETFDFRHKLPNSRASSYGFSFTQKGETTPVVAAMSSVKGKDWGEGQFKNAACEFCDDVLAECADVVIGDAWLPEYLDDYRGKNILVTRNLKLDTMIREGVTRGDIVADDISADQIAKSQASGLRHRREGLAHRLAVRKQKGQWYPVKRVDPQIDKSLYRRWVYNLRLKIAETSSSTFSDVLAEGLPLTVYEKRMAPVLKSYRYLVEGASKVKSTLRKLKGS